MLPSLLAVALVSLRAGVVHSESARHHEAIGSLHGVFTAGDYPAEALDRNQQGTVAIRVRIDKQGEVSDCTIEHSSGFGVLDEQTCRIVRLRAKFKPARDRRGRAIASEKRDQIAWRIAGEEVAPGKPASGSIESLISSDDYPPQALDRGEQGTVGVLLRIDAKGVVGKCVVESTSGSAVLDAQTCRLLSLRAKFDPARDREGNAVASEYHTRIVWQIGEDRAPSKPWSTRLVFSFGGSQPTCRFEADGAMSPAPGAKPLSCEEISPLPFPPLRELPPATASAVFEQRFALGSNPVSTPAGGGVPIARQVIALQIGAAGKVVSCKSIGQSDGIPWPDPCPGIASETFDPRQNSTGKDTPYAATITYSLYVSSEGQPGGAPTT